jgi:hypothetical protein
MILGYRVRALRECPHLRIEIWGTQVWGGIQMWATCRAATHLKEYCAPARSPLEFRGYPHYLLRSVMASSKQSSYWPRIDSIEKAVEVMHHGSVAAAISAVLTAGFCVAAIYLQRPVLGLDGWGLIDAALFAVVSWRVYRLSLPWAVAGLLVFTAEKIYGFMSNPRVGVGSSVVGFIFFLYYLHAVRAGVFLRRANKISASSPSDLPEWTSPAGPNTL